ncbi:hypothetical protein BDV26DRAFT_263066 [Aspergillus bertholletiae]|uniref:Uncharacterized protein n=1 Tax=Aspergillus bertholletiae TaxID=1226010 RepID=A0A5N7B7L2_9EURO|nr:hypothetical protein BDV26DRAFT_263066 [Aspergillus bertholletiae]
MDNRSATRSTASATQQPTHLDLAEYQAEWARIHENTVKQLEQLKANGKPGNGSGAGSQRSPSNQSPS